MENPILSLVLDTDSYKYSHWKQYPKGTSAMFSYFESRGGEYDRTVFFGLQYYLKKFLSTPITAEQVKEAAFFAQAHGVPFNYEGWIYIANELKGKLPVRIRAVPEGTIVPVKNILMSVESTDPKVFWIVSWLETLLVRIWYPTTVATRSWDTKQTILKYLKATADDANAEIMFKLHDFGSRGVSSQETAAIGGAAHLVNFMGTDTIAGIWMLQHYYDAKQMPGFSIPAAEHSTMTMWGKDQELQAYDNMITQYGDMNIFACVSDSYDIYNATEKLWGEALKDKVEKMKAVLVVRPDSGDPVKVPVELVEILDKKFGSTVNSKGFKVLNKVRVIQGDGIGPEEVEAILEKAKQLGFSASNFAFGMGGGLLQKLNRDTQKFAFKCSWAMVDGKEVDVYKQPVTDTGKKSKKGLIDLIKIDGKFLTVCGHEIEDSELVTVYENGEIKKTYTLDEIRAKSNEKPAEQFIVTGWTQRTPA